MGYYSTVSVKLELKEGVTKEEFEEMYKKAKRRSEVLNSYYGDLVVTDDRILDFEGDHYMKFYDHEILADTIAKFVVGTIDVCGEQGEMWRLVFDGYKWKEENAKIIYKDVYLEFCSEYEDTFPYSLKRELSAWWAARQI